MRGNQDEQEEVFSYIPLEMRVPPDHPLRRVREMTDRALQELSSWFDQLYGQTGRPSIPPEQLLRAQILQALYTIRSEPQSERLGGWPLLVRPTRKTSKSQVNAEGGLREDLISEHL
jgi:hypothetical protein